MHQVNAKWLDRIRTWVFPFDEAILLKIELAQTIPSQHHSVKNRWQIHQIVPFGRLDTVWVREQFSLIWYVSIHRSQTKSLKIIYILQFVQISCCTGCSFQVWARPGPKKKQDHGPQPGSEHIFFSFFEFFQVKVILNPTHSVICTLQLYFVCLLFLCNLQLYLYYLLYIEQFVMLHKKQSNAKEK